MTDEQDRLGGLVFMSTVLLAEVLALFTSGWLSFVGAVYSVGGLLVFVTGGISELWDRLGEKKCDE